MKRLIIYGLSFILLCIGFYHATIYAIPYYVYGKFHKTMVTQRGLDVNEFSFIMAPDESSRLVVKPNPDFAYASAFFDLSGGPVKLVGSMPDSTYWSVALYKPNTINFYIKNDMQYKSNALDLTLGHQDSDLKVDISSPVIKGFILIRLLIKDRNQTVQDLMMSHLQTLSIDKI